MSNPANDRAGAGDLVNHTPGQTRLLVRHFYARFLYNDFISPNGEAQATLPILLGCLAVPGLFMLVGLFFSYSSPFLSPSERLLLSLRHKYFFIALSMIVTALATALQWEALAIDGRDLANLGPLPLGPGTLVRAKSIALLLFVSTFAVALNAIPSIGFPAAWMSLVPIGPVRALWLTAAHALVTLAAAAFGFFAVLALRALVLVVSGPRLFRRLSTTLQFLVVLGLATAFCLVPAGAAGVRQGLERETVAARLSPPMWFLGTYEALTARGLLGDPQLMARTKWSFWQGLNKSIQDRMDPRGFERLIAHGELRARGQYEALQPALDRLAGTAWAAFVIAMLAAAGLYALAHARHAGRLRESLVPVAPRRGPLRRLASAAVRTLVARSAVTRAAFSFTIQALARSGRHRLYLAGYLAVGLALATVSAAPALLSGTSSVEAPPSAALALQGVLAFFLLVGVRAVAAVPAELRSNWLFQASWTGELPAYLAGVRRAVAFGLALPLLLALLPLHATWLGWRVALWHLAFGWLSALLLIELSFLGLRKLPFTCTYVPRGSFKFTWPGYLVAYLLYAHGLAGLEALALGSARGPWLLGAALAASLAGAWLYRAVRLRGRPAVVFDELPEPAALALNL